jgi:hypothetical protein
MVMRLRTASSLARFVSPRNASCSATVLRTDGDASRRLTCALIAAATACMFASRAASACGPPAAAGPGARASGAMFGSSVHGWITSSGASDRMTSPGSPPKPEMWSACRCVATTMWSLPAQSSLIWLAIASRPPSGPKLDALVEPKSIKTFRASPLAYVNVIRNVSPKPQLYDRMRSRLGRRLLTRSPFAACARRSRGDGGSPRAAGRTTRPSRSVPARTGTAAAAARGRRPSRAPGSAGGCAPRT